jgi:putative Ca2+/H+ antiporter (TMEM165/GDT1 family)
LIEYFLRSAVELFWGWVGASVIIALVAGAVGLVIPQLRLYAVAVIAGALGFSLIATHYFIEGSKNGRERTRAEWAAAALREKADGDKIAAEAAAAIAAKPPSERVFRDDPRNRANWPNQEIDGRSKMRGLD